MEERMKFITEYDLRARFNEQPFTDYIIEKNTRLTPGARQFLSDRRITILEDGADRSVKVQETDRKRIPEACQACEAADSKKDSLAIAKLLSDVEVLEAEFLVITSQIIETDIEIAGQMSKAGHEFGRIKTLLTDGAADLNISFEGCTGMDKDHFGKDLGNCFDITDFYIQSPNGKIIVQMNALRAKIRAMRISAAEALSADKEEKRQEAVTEAVNQIINKLSQLICMAAGVKTCRRT